MRRQMKMKGTQPVNICCVKGMLHRTPRAFILSLLAMMMLTTSMFAQEGNKNITGTVIFEATGEGVPGASVVIKGTTQGVITDLEGNFRLQAATGDILVISFLGYQEVELTVGAENHYNVSMKEDVTQLDEVVKIGYGTMKRSDLTGSVVSVSSDEIERANATTFDQVLQGRAAGVLVTQNTGQPGGGVTVQIRGINSLNGDTEPLYIIDGIPVSGYTGDNTNALATINPNDIASIELLKDASSTAIYGTQASNGVVLITTKRGKMGETRVSYNGTFGLQQLPKYIDVLNLQEYAEFLNEREEILGWGSKPEFADPTVLGEGTNWQKEMFRIAPKQTHNVSVSGGNERTNFLLSGGVLDEEGIVIGSNFKRYSFLLNIDNQTRDWLKTGASAAVSRTAEEISISENNLLSIAIEQAPDIPIYNPDGTWGGPPDEEEFGVSNPIAEALEREDIKKRTQLRAGLYAEMKFLKWFTFRSDFGTNIEYTNTYEFVPRNDFGGYSIPVNSSDRYASQSIHWITTNRLSFQRTFAEKHDLQVMAVQEAQESTWESVGARRENFLTNTIHEVNAGDI